MQVQRSWYRRLIVKHFVLDAGQRVVEVDLSPGVMGPDG